MVIEGNMGINGEDDEKAYKPTVQNPLDMVIIIRLF